MYLLVLLCFITVLHSPEALIHCIRVLSSIYNCYISNIITQIICFSSCLKIAGPRVGPGPAPTGQGQQKSAGPGLARPLDSVAAYANTEDKKSISSYIFIANRGAITWGSKKQNTIALS